ncbi:putative reverse transcriptase domain-containing protein [Tanacetum coccineum]
MIAPSRGENFYRWLNANIVDRSIGIDESRLCLPVHEVIAALVILISSESSEESVVSHVLRVILFGAIDEVMAASVIPILSDSSEVSVGSHVPRVILFGAIPAIIPVIPVVPTVVPIVPADPLVEPEVGAVSFTSPARVLDLVDYSSFFDSDPSDDSLPLAPELPLISPFLCCDDSEADSESEPAEKRPERHESLTVHDVMVSRLSWRRVSHRSSDRYSSPDFTSDSSSSGSSSDFSTDTSLGSLSDSLSDTSSVHSSGCDAPGQSHSGPSTRVASLRLVYPSVMTLRYSEAFRCWRSAPLSTPYPPMTLKSSLDSSYERSLDSSSPSAGPSHKRCRSPTTLVPSSTPVWRSITPTHADLLLPRKRFRDSYSPEDSKEEHMEIGTADAEDVADLGIRDGVGVDTEDCIGMGVEIAASNIRGDEDGFETAQRQLEAGQLMASRERAGLTDRIRRLGRENLRVRALLCIEIDLVDSLRHHMALLHEEFFQIHKDRDDARKRLRRLKLFVERRLRFRPLLDMTITCFRMTPKAIKELIAQRVTKALANYEAIRTANALETENQSQNGCDDDNGNGGNGDGGNNRNGKLNENYRGAMSIARVCTYQDFVKCQSLNFKGSERVVSLTRWFEKMKIVFHINNCPEVYQVKYAICTLLDSALTWWNSHKRIIGVDAAFSMTWRGLMKLMTEVNCPRNEIQKIETELWNLTMKNNDLAAYTQRFQEWTLLCTRKVPGEEERIERYVGGLANIIQGNVMSVKPTRLQDAIRLANSLMDQKLKGYAIKSVENKYISK